jgi:hypothetical protein
VVNGEMWLRRLKLPVYEIVTPGGENVWNEKCGEKQNACCMLEACLPRVLRFSK